MVITVKADNNAALVQQNLDDDPEFMEALQEVLQDPVRRKELISFLETIGLLPSAHQWPA